MDVTENIKKLAADLPSEVKIVAISKTRTTDEIMKLYECGHRIFGENRVQELVLKKQELPDDIEWHMVGHLQSNKVKFIAPFVSLIHSVDSIKLLKTINKEAKKNRRVIDCLLQIHIALEESKFGFSDQEVVSFMNEFSPEEFKWIRIRGLMGMATFSDDEDLVRTEFRSLAGLFEMIRNTFFPADPVFNELSMGMSGDYRIAAEEGSTMVRIGSLIFGERNK